jgi:hypothetical protein
LSRIDIHKLFTVIFGDHHGKEDMNISVRTPPIGHWGVPVSTRQLGGRGDPSEHSDVNVVKLSRLISGDSDDY